MKKKEIVIIAVIIGLALMLYLFIKPKNNGPMIKVVHGDKTVDLLDINVDNWSSFVILCKNMLCQSSCDDGHRINFCGVTSS